MLDHATSLHSMARWSEIQHIEVWYNKLQCCDVYLRLPPHCTTAHHSAGHDSILVLYLHLTLLHRTQTWTAIVSHTNSDSLTVDCEHVLYDATLHYRLALCCTSLYCMMLYCTVRTCCIKAISEQIEQCHPLK